jgi:hypothetical protein
MARLFQELKKMINLSGRGAKRFTWRFELLMEMTNLKPKYTTNKSYSD